MEIHGIIDGVVSMELHGTFPWNSMENVLNPPWKISMKKFQQNSIEIGVLMFSMEFHVKCPNPPCKYFACKSMENFHGNPWNSMEVFHTGETSIKPRSTR